ncbi:MAG: nuclear transport factor 2 family protein [Planctomycetes bacterium]|nr:nuclear transport factor 2 family protein [Planctomycetota bacterium]
MLKRLFLPLLFLAVLFPPVLFSQIGPTPPKETKEPTADKDVDAVKSVLKKLEESTAKEDLKAYLTYFSPKVAIETPEGDTISYKELEGYMKELFDAFSNLKDEPIKDYEIKINGKEAVVTNTYELSGIPVNEKEDVLIDEGVLVITFNKSDIKWQIVKVNYIVTEPPDEGGESSGPAPRDEAAEFASRCDEIKEGYGIDINAPGALEIYRSLILQEIKDDVDLSREETETRIALIKRYLARASSELRKKELSAEIKVLEMDKAQLPTEDEINKWVEEEIAYLSKMLTETKK